MPLNYNKGIVLSIYLPHCLFRYLSELMVDNIPLRVIFMMLKWSSVHQEQVDHYLETLLYVG